LPGYASALSIIPENRLKDNKTSGGIAPCVRLCEIKLPIRTEEQYYKELPERYRNWAVLYEIVLCRRRKIRRTYP